MEKSCDRRINTRASSNTSSSSPSRQGANSLPFKASKEDFRAKFKTELCRNWKNGRTCEFGRSCAFAHGTEELRDQSPTEVLSPTPQACLSFKNNGYCLLGALCEHTHEPIRRLYTKKRNCREVEPKMPKLPHIATATNVF